jgi:predicted exporter
MTGSVERVLLAMHRRRGVVFVLVAVLVAGSVLLASRTKLESNILRLVMREDLSMGVLRTLEKNPLFESFYIDASGADRDTLKQFADAAMGKVKNLGLADASPALIDEARIARTMALLFDKRFYLTGLKASAAPQVLTPGALEKQIQLSRVQLLSIAAPILKERVARDPVGLFGLVEPRLKLAAGTMALGREGSCLFSADGGHCLMSFQPAAHPSDFEASARLADAVDGIVQGLRASAPFDAVRTLAMGPHLFAAESGRIVKRDVTIAFVVSGALMVFLFFVFFRHLQPLVSMVVVLSFSVAVGIVAASLATGDLHGITLGFASTLLGITIDYVIHVESACGAGGGGESFAPTAGAVARIFPSLLGGWGTTAAVFLLLATSGFPLLRQMGIVAAVGVTTAFLAALLVLPLLPRRSRGPHAGGSARLAALTGALAGRRSLGAVVTAAAAALVVLAAISLPRVGVDANVENLDYRSPHLASDMETFQKRWGLMGKGDLVLARAPTFEKALQANDRVFEILEEARRQGRVASFISVSPLIPSARTQAASLQAVLSAEGGIREALGKAALAYGFDETFFQPFFDDLERSRAGKEAPLGPDALGGTFIETILKSAAVTESGGVTVLSSFVPSKDRTAVLARLPRGGGTISWFNRRVFLSEVFDTLIGEVTRTVVLGLAVVLIILLALFRSIRLAALAALPIIVSLPTTAAVFAWTGHPLNALGVLSFCLVTGLGIDYGIFMTNAVRGKTSAAGISPAVLLSALTTLVSFGVLAFCRSPALNAVGKVTALGITLAMISALIVVPAAYGLFFARKPS